MSIHCHQMDHVFPSHPTPSMFIHVHPMFKHCSLQLSYLSQCHLFSSIFRLCSSMFIHFHQVHRFVSSMFIHFDPISLINVQSFWTCWPICVYEFDLEKISIIISINNRHNMPIIMPIIIINNRHNHMHNNKHNNKHNNNNRPNIIISCLLL